MCQKPFICEGRDGNGDELTKGGDGGFTTCGGETIEQTKVMLLPAPHCHKEVWQLDDAEILDLKSFCIFCFTNGLLFIHNEKKKLEQN